MVKEDNLSSQERAEVKKEIDKSVKKQLLEQTKSKASYFRQEFKHQTAAAIIAAFGFLIALVWKDIIVNAVDLLIKQIPSLKYTIISTLISAVIVTFICVVGIILINLWAKKPENNK